MTTMIDICFKFFLTTTSYTVSLIAEHLNQPFSCPVLLFGRDCPILPVIKKRIWKWIVGTIDPRFNQAIFIITTNTTSTLFLERPCIYRGLILISDEDLIMIINYGALMLSLITG